jgi:hypothetical protein
MLLEMEACGLKAYYQLRHTTSLKAYYYKWRYEVLSHAISSGILLALRHTAGTKWRHETLTDF